LYDFRRRSRCTGKERDAETGLDYFGARYLSSTQGRWTSPDPTLLSVNAYNPQSWNRYTYVLNNPLKFIDPLGLWELAAADNDTVDKKGKHHHHVTVTARQSQKGDDGASLAKQLGLKGKAAEKFAAKVGSGDNVQLSQQGGRVGDVFTRVEQGLTEQANYTGKGGGPADADCSLTSARVGFGDSFLQSMGTNVMDSILPNRASPEAASDGMVGDIVRYANSKNLAVHFASFIFADDSGTPIVFSKSGETGPYHIAPAGALEGPHPPGADYGTIQGLNKGDSGYYRPNN
jgi:RHS repeat-associated protein